MTNFENDDFKSKFKELLENKNNKEVNLKSEQVRKEMLNFKGQNNEKPRIFRRKSI